MVASRESVIGYDPLSSCAGISRRCKGRMFQALALLLMIIPTVAWAGTATGVKNVIVMVPDGCHASIQTLARWVKGAPLALDEINTGAVKTHMANSVITGSAAAATAFATGHKTSAHFLSVGPKTEDLLSTYTPEAGAAPYVPLASVLEGAKLMGKATGLVATSRVTYATPAAFASHFHGREMENELMEQMVYQDMDVVFGGGKRHLLPVDQEGGLRTDGEDLLGILRDRGYRFVETKSEMEALTGGRVWGLFSSSHLSPDTDRAEFGPTEPSLAEMTTKALEILSEDPDGFFLMIEGSQVDLAAHANDPIYMVTEFLSFDAAVRVALDFAKWSDNTLLLVFPDHTTGGLSIGNWRTDYTYTATTVEDVLAPLEGMKITSFGVGKKIGGDQSPANIKAQILEWWGIEATYGDIREIRMAMRKGQSIEYALAHVISKNHTVFGWTTHGHSGGDVPLWSYGPHRMVGLYDNTELAQGVANAFGFDLSKVNERLFVDADTVSASVAVDMKDPENPVLKIRGASLPCSKDILILGGKTYRLEGIVVHAPEIGKVFIPQEAVNIINGNEALPDISADETLTDPEMCASYDFFTGVMHVPCFDDGADSYWLDLQLVPGDAVLFELIGWGYN